MGTLVQLKLVSARKPNNLPAVQQRRNKMSRRLWEQIELARAQQAGTQFTVNRFRSYMDKATGERKQVEGAKRIKAWWFTTDNGKLAVGVRYGARLLELAKGKTAVEVATAADLVPTLELIKVAVEAGELDTQLEAAAGTLKRAFGK